MICVKNIKKAFAVIAQLFLLSIGSSQCFAQSQVLSSNSDSAKTRQYLELLNSVYLYIQNSYVDEVSAQKLYQGALRGMLESLDDPYSVYMPKEDWRSISDTTTGSFGGVGLSITKPTAPIKGKPTYVEVVQPIDDTPGAKAGIQPGDKIVKIDGVDTSTITMDDVLAKLRGVIGTEVTVTIQRGKKMEFDRTLVRALIDNPTVKYGMIKDTGYIRISEFSTNTAEDVQKALNSFKKDSYSSLIIDLRNNGGGLLSAAVDIADMFIDSGVIVSTKSRISYENKVYKAKTKNTTVDKNIPVIVLINRASASASEILAGAFKDSHRAFLVGERSYGKGSVQIPTALIDSDGIKITVAKYFSPSDINVDKIGIEPDREVKYPDFSDEEEKAYTDLMQSDEIENYVEKFPDLTDDDIGSYAVRLQEKYKLDLRVLRKVIRNEVDRTRPSRLYDLDYDLQLNEALNIFKSENFKSLMAKTKTLKEFQAEKELKAEQEKLSVKDK